MSKKVNLQESIMNVLGLVAIKEGCEKMNYNNLFYGFNKILSEKPEFFPGLYFSTSGGQPHSNILEDIVSSLGTWQVLSVENPRYQYIKVNKDIFVNIEDEIKQDYGEPIFEDFMKIAKTFSEEIKKLEK